MNLTLAPLAEPEETENIMSALIRRYLDHIGHGEVGAARRCMAGLRLLESMRKRRSARLFLGKR